MAEIDIRLEVLSEMLGSIARLSFWKYTPNFELLETSCAETGLFLKLFQSKGYQERITAHFRENDCPIMLSDSLGFVWLAAAEKRDCQVQRLYLLGPTFTTELLEKNLEAKMGAMDLSFSHRREVISQLQALPVIDYDTFLRYGVMLHYCITGSAISRSEISLGRSLEPEQTDSIDRWEKKEFHGTWHLEQAMVKLIEEGNLNYRKLMQTEQSIGKVGVMSIGDPLRQAKNAIIVQTALATRAAIRGGISPELAYSISDYYIQMVEDCKTIDAVYVLSRKMVQDFIRRVHKIRSLPEYSSLTLACMDYVSLHVAEKITVADIAGHLSYADYYLTARFKKETGETLRDYISRQKIEQAKLLLSSTNLNVQDIADQLSFANASYFGSAFRKFTGVSPGEYRNAQGKK